MVINEMGASLQYNGVNYVVGAPILATDQSVYQGLYGRIKEIRDGEDKETDNESPDLYCEFDQPVIPSEIAAVENAFSKLHGKPCAIGELGLDLVIMAPEMVQLIPEEPDGQVLTVYSLTEDFALDGDEFHSELQFTDQATARYKFHTLLLEANSSEWMERWKRAPTFGVEEQVGTYECYLNGEYCANHYRVCLQQKNLNMGCAQLQQIGQDFADSVKREDFIGEAEQIVETETLTSEQYARMISDPHIPDLIFNELSKNTRYWEEYWSAVDNVINTLIQKYRNEDRGTGNNNEEDEGK